MTLSRRDDAIVILLALVIVLGTVALANLLPGAGPTAPASTAAGPETDRTCLEWTDGCVVCQRTQEGRACSTPGIACVRQEPQCVRR